MTPSRFSNPRRLRAVALLSLLPLLVWACATPPEPPKPPEPPQPPPPPPSSVEVEPLQRQPIPEPVDGAAEDEARASVVEAGSAAEVSASGGVERPPADSTMSGEGNAQAEAGVQTSPALSAGDTGAAAAGVESGQRGAQGQATGLEARLNEELSRFDEALLQEQESLARQREQTHSGTGGEGSGSGGWPSGEDGQMSQGGGAEQGMVEEEGQAQGERGGIARTDERRTTGASSDKVPDARDDDIVARQLREAAERETDPELKERLWEEYRAYKQSVSRQAGS